jgi:hypothetical protein
MPQHTIRSFLAKVRKALEEHVRVAAPASFAGERRSLYMFF